MQLKSERVRHCLIFIMCLISGLVFQQSATADKEVAVLKKELTDLDMEIERTNKALKETQDRRVGITQELNLLNLRLRQRELLRKKLQADSLALEIRIREKNDSIDANEIELGKRKEEYAKLIYISYKNRDPNMDLMYLLASRSLAQLYARYEYLVQFRKNRLNAIGEIKRLNGIINDEKQKLEARKEDLDTLIARIYNEYDSLSRDQQRVNKARLSLDSEERDLAKVIARLEKEKEEIKKLIESEMQRLAEERKRGGNEAEIRASDQIGTAFKKSKGKLPMPVEKGTVTLEMGSYLVDNKKNFEAENLGIDIAAMPGSQARAVFEGEIAAISPIMGVGQVVLLRHGDYFTVYQNIGKLYVKAKQKVQQNQVLGDIFYDTRKGKCISKFMIWHNGKNLDPKDWLRN